MYDIFTYIWLIFMVNVGKYTRPMDGLGKPFIQAEEVGALLISK